eukprot:8226758-Pyramimonas_sp.AAC.1
MHSRSLPPKMSASVCSRRLALSTVPSASTEVPMDSMVALRSFCLGDSGCSLSTCLISSSVAVI